MAKELAAILGDTLLSGTTSVKVDDCLAGKKACILYFSAHWCPPCRGFTPTFVEAYKEYKAAGGGEAEVVFVSWDKSESQFKDYFKEMPWLAIPFQGTEKIRQGLGPKFGVNGIPAIVALGPDGKTIFAEGDIDLRSLVGRKKGAAFPMTREHVNELKAEQERCAKMVLAELGADFPPIQDTSGGSLQFDALLDGSDLLALVFGDGDSDDGSYRTMAEAQAKLSQGGASKTGKGSLSMVYLGWMLYNEGCDHAPFKKIFNSVTSLPGEFKKKLEMLFDQGVRPPHVLLLRRDESGSPVIMLNDPGARRIVEFGADGYPWSDARVAELMAIRAARVEALRKQQVNLQFLKGDGRDSLSAKDGREVKVDALAAMSPDTMIGLYFSAHWCPPCRQFTPMLAGIYSQMKSSGKSIEIIFVSSDKDEESFKEYFDEMPWLALPFPERQLKNDLSSVFEVNGIPMLVLLKPDGSLITTDGVQMFAQMMRSR